MGTHLIKKDVKEDANVREIQYKQHNRCGIIVYIKQLKHIRQLKQFGQIYYVSKKMKYALLYVNHDEVSRIVAILKKQNYVRYVTPSLKNQVRTDYHSKGEKPCEL